MEIAVDHPQIGKTFEIAASTNVHISSWARRVIIARAGTMIQ
jgi:hypothetical protein